MKTIYRTLHPEVKILDEKKGLVEYIASDETIDSYKEVIRSSGWRFTNFRKNAPFVDSHDYSSVDKLLGRVLEFRVAGGKLVETVQWAVDVPDNQLAQLGWRMTVAGYLKAVSVGFWPLAYVTQGDRAEFASQLQELKLPPESDVRTIYIEQEQIELSAVVLGSNPNALARAFKANVLTDSDIDLLSALTYAQRDHAGSATIPADVDPAPQQQARRRFLKRLNRSLLHI